MATTTVTIEGYKQLKPRVVNLFQENNRVDTIVFSLSPYVQDDIDLSNFDCYVVTYGVSGIDEQKLQYSTSESTMTIPWTIDNYTLSIGQTLSYQIVFKSNDESASVWHSYKGIIFCDESIPADENIASNYPTILRQFEERIEEIAEKILFAYEWMPVGTWIPIGSRIKRRFYLGKQTDYDCSCVIEDDSGNIISPLAKTVAYDPGDYQISSCLQNVIDYIIRHIKWCAKFCVNDGNTDNGLPDIIDNFSGTLSFKIGNTYSDLTATQANGECFVLKSAASIDCGSLPDGNYNIFLNKHGNGSAINNTIYRQHSVPESPYNNDIWYHAATNSAKIYKSSGHKISQISNPSNETFVGACSGNNTIISISKSSIFRSTNDGLSWSQTVRTDDLLCCHFSASKFLIGTSNGKVITSSDNGITWSESIVSIGEEIAGLCSDGTSYYAATRNGKIYRSTSLDIWNDHGIVPGMSLNWIAYHDGMFISCGDRGKIAWSTNASSWTNVQSWTTETLGTIRWLHSNTWTICCPLSQVGRFLITENNGMSFSVVQMDGTSTFDVSYANGEYTLVTADAVFCGVNIKSLDSITGTNRNYNIILNNKLFGTSGRVSRVLTAPEWHDFHSVPIGKITVLDGEISSIENFPFNQNWFEVNAETVANETMYGALRAAGVTDEQSDDCIDAAITPANIFRLAGYRKKSTHYSVGDIVGCPYHASIALRCETAGTTSNTILDVTGTIEIGDTISDGTVTWLVVPVNGETGVIEAKGDLIVGDSNGEQSRLAIGSDGQFLKVSNGSAAWEDGTSTITTKGDIIIGGDGGVEARLGIGQSGMFLKSGTGGQPEWASIPNPMTTAGDIIVGGTGGAQSRLGIGTAGQVMKVGSNNRPSWESGVVATLKYWS